MKKWLTKDICAALILMAFSVWWEWGATLIRIRDFDNGLSADYFPKLLGYVLLILSAILLAQGIAKVKRAEGDKKAITDHKIALGLLAGLFIYSLVLKKLGFVLCTAIFLFCMISILSDVKEGKKKGPVFFLRNIVLAIVLTAVIYLVFVKAFQIMLPTFSLF